MLRSDFTLSKEHSNALTVRGVINTPLGDMIACISSRGLISLLFEGEGKNNEEVTHLDVNKFINRNKNVSRDLQEVLSDPNYSRHKAIFEATNEWIQRYFNKEFDQLHLPPFDLFGTQFCKSVWRMLQSIPFGKTVSYGYVAEDLQKPSAARAVGTAVGKNPIIIMIPCHRVILGSGDIGGFGCGIERKRWLLDHEGVNL